jgi:predicted P-loop ATPase
MLERGHAPEAIRKTLLDPANPISAHVLDQAKAEDYAVRQVAKAIVDLDFRPDRDGIPLRNQYNIRIALIKMGVGLKYDRFADRILMTGLPGFGPALEDAGANRLWLQLEQRFGFRPGKDLLLAVLQDTARVNSFHPVLDYLDALRWDGIERLDGWLTTYAGAEYSEYTRAVGTLMLVASIRRVRQPGCKFDEMVVLESEQGKDKSSALRVMAVRDEWYTDDLPLYSQGKLVIEQLRGRWIVEAAELSGMRRADIEHLKALLSRQEDRARMSYDRLLTEVPRHSVVIGTTNSQEYLRDLTGNRRFWPVQVQAIELAMLKRDRDQLWAEAAAMEAAGTASA